jgi:cyclophilin family peptidyl-prolyl cis-trans isomerase
MKIALFLLAVLLAAGCVRGGSGPEAAGEIDSELPTPPPPPPLETPGEPRRETVEEPAPYPPPSLVEEMKALEENPIAVVVTNRGEFRFELYARRAPITVANFILLAESGFYDGLTFHRYEPGFVIQGGDPRGDGTGGSNHTIPLEVHPELTHVEGAVGMARSLLPDSASSQFYITLGPAHPLDGEYAVFGKVTEGMDVVRALRAGDRMETIRIER